jgi:PAS domain S-box-containing protein
MPLPPNNSSAARSPDKISLWMEHSAPYACRVDFIGRVVGIGPKLAGVLGLDPTRAPNMDFVSMVALPAERERLARIFHGSPLDLRDIHEATLIRVPDRVPRRVRWAVLPSVSPEGLPEHLFVGWPEEDWLRMLRQVANLSRVAEMTMDAVAIINPDGVIEYVNQSFTTLSGYPMAEVLGVHVSTMVSVPEDISIVQQALARFRRDDLWSGSVKFRRKDGSAMVLSVRIRPVTGSTSTGRRYIAVAQDVSRQQSLEKQVQELQRLESLGTLANGLAHRFNNVLAAISGQTELLMMSVADPVLQDRARRILESAMKGKELVDQIGLFGRRSEPRARLCDLAPVVRNAVRFIRSAQPRSIRIEESIPEELPSVMANTGEIHQVILNLMTNSIEAIGTRDGVIRVSLRVAEFPLREEAAPEKCLLIEVEDNGPGIDPAIRPRIFEPFFTTHSMATSSGLGLATVHGIVQRHGGLIQCESEPGKGATFRIALPLQSAAPRKETPSQAVPAPSAAPSRRRRILLADKAGYALDSGLRVLEELGYEVVASADPAEVERFLSEPKEKFDLFITALKIDGTGGVDLARLSRHAREDLPVLLCPDMRDNFDEEAALASGASAILRRPVQKNELAEVVSRLVGAGR